MKELSKANADEAMKGHGSLTGLHMFMDAAMGNRHDTSGMNQWRDKIAS